MPTFKARGKISFKKSRKVRALRKTRKAKPSKAIKNYVNRAINRKIETKICDVERTATQVFGLIADTDVQSLIPNIAQGTGEGARIGNKVNCSSLNLRMNLYCYNQSSTTPPVYFDIYIFKCKNKQVGGGFPTSGEMVQFLEDGSTSKQYLGTSLDGMRYLNNDLFTICLHKRVVLFNPYSSAVSQTASINPSRMFNFNLGKFVKNSWLINDGGTTVQNDNLYIAVGATLTNGATLPPATTFGHYDYLIQAKYKDA